MASKRVEIGPKGLKFLATLSEAACAAVHLSHFGNSCIHSTFILYTVYSVQTTNACRAFSHGGWPIREGRGEFKDINS